MRQDAVLEDALRVIDVIDEEVERGDALPQARLDALPLLARMVRGMMSSGQARSIEPPCS